mmetsp:Transcript_16463/g.29150  ORF Transcript_16463/g.29150 Transcript_16463/m.29150 type:complete len:130 (-) Transcript_16463:152-541(-)|eukprot:CAMPEP_0184524480 /NCGR_PEP_ID=MMETSP0198_2-20121128/9546_1 /TAXON_ID=1112570 /ORGANISM="Thraustochytrium sp., Strain LLF1b" /LENGTH=129 /DNA_ID=CAMNT_0026915793 /DNA_START=154 /DNA_END=543 /DNA_ORIENTATION=+
MAAGPFARLLAQALVAGVNVFSRAFLQAYQQAAANPEAAKRAAQAAKAAGGRKVMKLDEAIKVLNFDKMPATAEEVLQQYERYHKANDPAKGGSFYLQSKFFRAKEAIEADMKLRGVKVGEAPKEASKE